MRILIDTQGPSTDDPVDALVRFVERLKRREIEARRAWIDGHWELSFTAHDDIVRKHLTRKEDQD